MVAVALGEGAPACPPSGADPLASKGEGLAQGVNQRPRRRLQLLRGARPGRPHRGCGRNEAPLVSPALPGPQCLFPSQPWQADRPTDRQTDGGVSEDPAHTG